MNNTLLLKSLYDCNTPYLKNLFEKATYPWQILSLIEEYIKNLITQGIEGYERISDKVLIGKNVRIYDSAVIEGWSVIGEGSVLRPSAFLRGNVITGKNCVIGNSSELKNCVLLDNVQIPHYNYVGDSVLGNFSHLGAGTICSNLKNDGKNVVIHADTDYETGLRKVGAFLGDRANIGSSCVLNPGTVVGKDTSVYPLTMLRGVYKSGLIVKSGSITIDKSCIM